MEQKKSKKGLIIAVIAIIVAIVAIVAIILLANKKDDNSYRVIQVNSFEGDVSIERESNNSDIEIFKGLQLISNDKVAVESESLVELLIDSDKHIAAKENTAFAVVASGTEEDGKVSIELLYGESLFTIDNKLFEGSSFEVNTPNAALSVRGTTFNVIYNEAEELTVLSVIEGIVEVNAHDETLLVEEGQTVYIYNNEIVFEGENADNNESGNDDSDGDEALQEEPETIEIDLADVDYLVKAKDSGLMVQSVDDWGNKVKFDDHGLPTQIGQFTGPVNITYELDENDKVISFYCSVFNSAFDEGELDFSKDYSPAVETSVAVRYIYDELYMEVGDPTGLMNKYLPNGAAKFDFGKVSHLKVEVDSNDVVNKNGDLITSIEIHDNDETDKITDKYEFEYDSDGTIDNYKVTNLDGTVIENIYEYDDNGILLKIVINNTAKNSVAEFTFDENAKLLKATKTENDNLSYSYDYTKAGTITVKKTNGDDVCKYKSDDEGFVVELQTKNEYDESITYAYVE